jgi:hypothetical protein
VTKEYAPIAVFAFKRTVHLEATILALTRCPEAHLSDVTIFVDGPRNSHEQSDVDATVDVAKKAQGFRSLNVHVASSNKGLASSIIHGVSRMLKQSDKVIVLEDDIVVSHVFLEYMNSALDQLAGSPEVASIHGYSLPLQPAMAKPYFLKGADCWGWATWVDRWDSVEWDVEVLLQELSSSKSARSELDLGGAYPFTKMLQNQVEGQVDSWAIRWHVSMFLQNRLTLYPGQSLVRNIGMDGSGTHGDNRQDFFTALLEVAPDLSGIHPVESREALERVMKFYKRSRSIRRRVLVRLTVLIRQFSKHAHRRN